MTKLRSGLGLTCWCALLAICAGCASAREAPRRPPPAITLYGPGSGIPMIARAPFVPFAPPRPAPRPARDSSDGQGADGATTNRDD